MCEFVFYAGDIFDCDVDCIVIPVNVSPTERLGLDKIAYEKAGLDRMIKERLAIGQMDVGDFFVSEGFELKAKKVIHIVTPTFLAPNWEKTLSDCYREVVFEAEDEGCKTIAFPLLSAGNMGVPIPVAMDIARDTLEDEAKSSSLSKIHLVLTPGDMYVYENDYSDIPGELLDEMVICGNHGERIRQFDHILKLYERKMADEKERQKIYREYEEYKKLNAGSDNVMDREIFLFSTAVDIIKGKIGKGKKFSSQNEFANRCDIDTANFSRLLRGQREKVDKKAAINMAIALELPFEEFRRLIFCLGNPFPTNNDEYEIEKYVRENRHLKDNDYLDYDEILKICRSGKKECNREINR